MVQTCGERRRNCNLLVRASCWIVAHRHGQPETIADLDLQSLFPGSNVTAIAPTGVSQHQKLVGSAKPRPAVALPLGGDGIDGERGRVARRTNADKPAVVGHVIDAIESAASALIASIHDFVQSPAGQIGIRLMGFAATETLLWLLEHVSKALS